MSVSQFILCKTSNDLSSRGGIKVSEYVGDNKALVGVVKEYFPGDESDDIWFIENIDSLFTHAQEQVNEKAFIHTELYTLLRELYEISDILVLWYSDDYQDLDCVATKTEFLNIVEGSIKTPTCECYVYLKK